MMEWGDIRPSKNATSVAASLAKTQVVDEDIDDVRAGCAHEPSPVFPCRRLRSFARQAKDLLGIHFPHPCRAQSFGRKTTACGKSSSTDVELIDLRLTRAPVGKQEFLLMAKPSQTVEVAHGGPATVLSGGLADAQAPPCGHQDRLAAAWFSSLMSDIALSGKMLSRFGTALPI
jgi:hypothetical protein